MRIIVVGAGLAGLHAAWRLHSSGIDVDVLEARDRVGGRTWSHELDNGMVVERGGEFIAESQHAIRSLAAELDIALTPQGFSYDCRETPGHDTLPLSAHTETLAVVNRYTRDRLEAGSGDFPVAEAFAESGVDSDVAFWVHHRYATSTTIPTAKLSARALVVHAEAESGYGRAVRVAGGNQVLSLELAKRLGDRIRTGLPAVAVRQSGGEIEVTDARGGSWTGHGVIVATPQPMLGELTFDPGLPETVLAALAHREFGDAAKLHLMLEAGVPPRGVQSAKATWWTWTPLPAGATDDTETSAPVLGSFAGGTNTIDALVTPDPNTWRSAALGLRRAVPGAEVTAAGEALVTLWRHHRWTRGSYSEPGVGWTPEHDAALQAIHGRLTLAGEHTAGANNATMNGAVESGARAAQALTAALEQLR